MIKKNHCIQNKFDVSHSFQTELRDIESLKTDPKHPWKVTPRQAEKAASLIRASFLPPVIIDGNDTILTGQMFVDGAKILGMNRIQVIIADSLSEAQHRIFRTGYARVLKDTELDTANLVAELQYLMEASLSCEVDFTVECTGFETAEIDLLLADPPEATMAAEDIMPAVGKIAVTKPGDIWKLGRHVIICGDALDPAVHRQFPGDVRVKLLCSDPPFNIPIPGFVSGNGAIEHENFPMACGELSSQEFEDFLFTAISNSTDSLADGGCCYLFMDWRHDRELQAAARRCNLTQLNLCIWDKGRGGMGNLYRSQHELVFVYRKGTTSHTNNIRLGKYGRNRTNVWSYPSATMSSEGREALKDHPTPKPVALVEDIIRDVTATGDIVLDPFLGGGATLIGAEKTNRKCFGIELDPKYVDVAIRRWQEFTGKKAFHAETGLSFDDHGGRHE